MPMSVVAIDIHGNPNPTGPALVVVGGHTVNGVGVATQSDIGTVNTAITAETTARTTAVAAETTARAAAIAALPTFYPTMPFLQISAAHAVASTDYFIEATASAGVPTYPTAVGIQGRSYIFKNKSGSNITPATTSSQTIDGSAPAALANLGVLRLVSDGANWLTW
jgi:hypothetical protein